MVEPMEVPNADYPGMVENDLGLERLYQEDGNPVIVDPPLDQQQELPEIKDKCFSSYEFGDSLSGEDVVIDHISLVDHTIDEATEIILCELRDPEPRRISVACYQSYLGTHSVQEIMDQLAIIAAAAQQSNTHKIVFCSTVFLPEQQPLWGDQCKLNFEVRRLCFTLKRPSIALHKVALLLLPETKGCLVKKSCFTEAMAGTGLGVSLAHETINKMKLWIVKYHGAGFRDNAPLGWRMTVYDMRPVPLQHTVGYKNPSMVGFLRRQGMYKDNQSKPIVKRRKRNVATKKDLGGKPAGVQAARPRSDGRSASSLSYQGSSRRSSKTSSNSFGQRRMSSDSVFDHKLTNIHRRTQSDRQLSYELEEMRISRSRMELDNERRYGQERQRQEKLELALDKARDEVSRLSTQVADLKRENHNLRMDNERVQFNNQEAWNIIKSDWRRRDEEQARREKKK